MSNEFDEYPSLPIPDFGTFITKKVAILQDNIPSTGFDPYKLMVQKKKMETGEIVNDAKVNSWLEEDIKKLEEFCKKYGIIGFNCGRMHPIAALAMLKVKLGVVNNDMPEAKNTFGPNYPYSDAINKKMLLKG